jgi:hypothetical protein
MKLYPRILKTGTDLLEQSQFKNACKIAGVFEYDIFLSLQFYGSHVKDSELGEATPSILEL